MTARRMFLKFLIVGVLFMPFLTQAEANIEVCSPSNTNIVIDARVPGEISTPEFPDGSRDTSCSWKIQAPENFRLEITIKELKLTGIDDYLIIRDGAEASSPLIGKYGPCASGSLKLFSSGNFAFLQMVSSVFTVNDKLQIAFKPTDPDDIDCSNGENPSNLCGLNTYLREPSGVVSSPNFPNNYGASRNCLWTIIAPPGYRVQFTIQWLGIEDHRYSRPGSCGDDSIRISEYRGNYTNDVTVLCGCKRLFTFVSFMEKMWVRFSSYKKNNWPGFYATYKALAPEECPAGKSNCSLTSTVVVGFDAQGQVCRTSVKTTTKVTNQETTSLLPSSVKTLARLGSLTSTPALEITATVHLTFSESNRWHSNTSSPQKTTAVEIKKQGTVSSLTVSPTLILPIVNASVGRIVHSSEVITLTSVSLLRSNTLELATSVTSSSSFPKQTLIQARRSFATAEDSNGIRSPIGQIKTPRDAITSTGTASYVLGTKNTAPVVPTSSLARADHVISTSKPEDFSSEGISMKPSKASEETPSGPEKTPIERPTTQYIPVNGTDNPLIGKNEN
ncbi:CUB and zona pellucida-like domain-containing protein 1 [Orbicella faveolata]|uniref:CUB and zona pellucida-like domain-containing protein 1 n=1 Tax=Orbicella faveolata TaxID=48498 RepID=UPI0009E341DB|nr:CUB and zona pellucida-like domain-containing protein 1 [Orbicella faveolata]